MFYVTDGPFEATRDKTIYMVYVSKSNRNFVTSCCNMSKIGKNNLFTGNLSGSCKGTFQIFFV